MTDVAQTSIDSYHAFDIETLGRDQLRVLMVIKRNGPITDREIMLKTGLTRHNICGRRGELKEQELIRQAGYKYDAETQRNVKAWSVTGRVL